MECVFGEQAQDKAHEKIGDVFDLDCTGLCLCRRSSLHGVLRAELENTDSGLQPDTKQDRCSSHTLGGLHSAQRTNRARTRHDVRDHANHSAVHHHGSLQRRFDPTHSAIEKSSGSWTQGEEGAELHDRRGNHERLVLGLQCWRGRLLHHELLLEVLWHYFVASSRDYYVTVWHLCHLIQLFIHVVPVHH